MQAFEFVGSDSDGIPLLTNPTDMHFEADVDICQGCGRGFSYLGGPQMCGVCRHQNGIEQARPQYKLLGRAPRVSPLLG